MIDILAGKQATYVTGPDIARKSDCSQQRHRKCTRGQTTLDSFLSTYCTPSLISSGSSDPIVVGEGLDNVSLVTKVLPLSEPGTTESDVHQQIEECIEIEPSEHATAIESQPEQEGDDESDDEVTDLLHGSSQMIWWVEDVQDWPALRRQLAEILEKGKRKWLLQYSEVNVCSLSHP